MHDVTIQGILWYIWSVYVFKDITCRKTTGFAFIFYKNVGDLVESEMMTLNEKDLATYTLYLLRELTKRDGNRNMECS